MKYNALMKEWQKRLNMQDWRITLKVDCVPEDMTIDESSGCVSWAESTKTALIQIIGPKYYGQRVVPFDFEKTLVHELLHLKFSLLCDEQEAEGLRERICHQILDEIARALVEAKRYQPKQKENAE